MKPWLTIIAGACFALNFAQSQTPKPRIYASESGTLGVKLLPRTSSGGKIVTEAIVFSYDMQGIEQTKWKRNLINAPVRAYVSDEGHVITIDTFGNAGYNDVVVIYNRLGEKIGSYNLENLLDTQEINKHTNKTDNARYWTQNAALSFAQDYLYDEKTVKKGPYVENPYGKTLFVVKFDWGKTILFDLGTGEKIKNLK